MQMDVVIMSDILCFFRRLELPGKGIDGSWGYVGTVGPGAASPRRPGCAARGRSPDAIGSWRTDGRCAATGPLPRARARAGFARGRPERMALVKTGTQRG